MILDSDASSHDSKSMEGPADYDVDQIIDEFDSDEEEEQKSCLRNAEAFFEL